MKEKPESKPEAKPREQKERKPFLLRMDPALWNDLERWAQEELRSVIGQIEMILRQAAQKRKGAASGKRKLEADELKAPAT